MVLEVCAYTLRTCLLAAEAGADRLELCADPGQGGTTPSQGMIEAALRTGLPVFPMIRPRGGDFLYSRDELDVMRRDVRVCREAGCAGIVVGMQLKDGSLDSDGMKRFVDLADGMSVTCHKVFDGVPNAEEALEVLVRSGCSRVLTSGLAPTAMEGASVIRALNEQAAGRITVLVGGGVRAGNIAALAAATGAQEWHSSALTAASIDRSADPLELAGMLRALKALR